MKQKSSLIPLFVTYLLTLTTLSLSSATVRIDPLHEKQTFRGFGTCIAPWESILVDLYESESFQRIYAEELNLSILRVNGLPYVHPEVSNWEDISYENFNITSGGQQHAPNSRVKTYLDFAKAITVINPETRVIITVWSFPDWMKTNNSHLNGGDLRPDRREHAAKLLTEYVKLYENEGVDVMAVSFANEPRFAQFYNSQVIEPESYAEMLAVVGTRLEAEGFGDVLIYGPEHMTHDTFHNTRYINAIHSHPVASQYIDAFASHGYRDGVVTDPRSTASARLWSNLLDRNGWEFWVTEGGTGRHPFNSAIDEVGFTLHHLLSHSYVSAYTPWQITGLQADGHGLMQLGNFTGKTRVFQHFSASIQPGMKGIQAHTEDDIQVTSFADREEGTLSVILLNISQKTHDLDIEIPYVEFNEFAMRQSTANNMNATMPNVSFSNGVAKVDIPARSVVSLTATNVDFSNLPALVINGGEEVLRVPSTAGQINVTVTVDDPAYTWVPDTVIGQWARLTHANITGTGNGTVTLNILENTTDVERTDRLDVNGVEITLVQDAYTEPVISWWNDITPDPSSGARDTALLFGNYAGIGWIYDEFWPFAYSFSMGSWIWAVEEGGSASSFFAYDFGTAQWVWISGDIGIAYLFTDEDWLNLNE